MIPRVQIEFTLAMAEKGLRSETPPEVMAELCRVYLAWVDAPEGDVTNDHYICISNDMDMGALIALDGKRVKLVEVPDE